MFKADILNMTGGKKADADVRQVLCDCADIMSRGPEVINLSISSNLPQFDNRRIPLILSENETKPFSSHELMKRGSHLVKQMGHLSVKDAYNSTNLLYSGSNVVEYDLVENDRRGKYYVYSEPSVLQEITLAKNKGRFEEEKKTTTMGDEFLDDILESSYETINELVNERGHHVSSGKLLSDIMVLMRFYEEETRREERTCLDPVSRRLLMATQNKPLFKVAFITNTALMGLKVVFYPTALEWQTNETIKDASTLKSLLKTQMSILGYCMPRIVNKVERVKKKYVFCFEIDIKGSSNWNLPGHCKNDQFAVPYHFAQLKGANKNVLEITNTKMVTSLGVIECNHARQWMYHWLDEFYRRTTYAETMVGPPLLLPEDWKRRLLFSDIGPELPFRNKSIIMDLDFCLIGMCYNYLAGGQGILLTKHAHERDNNGWIFARVAEDNEKEEKKDKVIPPPPPSLRADVVASAYDDIIEKNKFSILLNYADQFGMFLADKNQAPRLAMNIVLATTKTEKKECLDALPQDTSFMLKMITKTQKLIHENVLPYALVQIVMRYECRNIKLPRDHFIFCSRMKLKKWSLINFSEVWKFAYEESINPPSEDLLANLPLPNSDDGRHQPPPPPQQSIINEILSSTASTFASGVDKNDTMFSWVVALLAERFCALYNIASNPKAYYNQQCCDGKLYYEGGVESFEKMCGALLSELELYVPKNASLKICRRAVKGYEMAIERNKNMINSKVCKVKMAELKIVRGSNKEFSNCVNIDELSHATNMTECVNDKVFDALFEPLINQEEVEMSLSEEDEEEESYSGPPNFEEDVIQREVASAAAAIKENSTMTQSQSKTVIEDFFAGVNDNRSFKFRSSLCHRQKYVSTDIVKEMEKELSQLLTLKPIISDDRSEILKEIRERNVRMRDWVVPFTMPTDSFKNLSDCDGKRCNCFQIYSGGSSQGLEESHDKCVKLLVLPLSLHLKSLILALKFNTMAAERRYFSDVSTALGFVTTPTASSSCILSDSRWKSILEYKCEGKFLKNTNHDGFYDNFIMSDRRLMKIFQPRTMARKRRTSMLNNNNKHTGFFAGVWALSAQHDLETTVLGCTVMSPHLPTPILNITDNERLNLQKKIGMAIEARHYFNNGSSESFFYCFEQMMECMRRTNVSQKNLSDVKGDFEFFSNVFQKYGKSYPPPGTKMWVLFHVISDCFKNSLPVDWNSLIPNWTKNVLNLTEDVPNIDESGAVFEVAKFLSVCARSFFGSCLNNALSADVWERLLGDESSWIGELARAYEKGLEDNDIRVYENFINSSTFLTNNNISDVLKISSTDNQDVRYEVWRGGDLSRCLRKRAEWLSVTENGMEDGMTFSFVLATVSLFIVMLEGKNVKILAENNMLQGVVPLIRGLKMVSGWSKTYVETLTSDDMIGCIREVRFTNIRKDSLYFYRFVAYTIGLIAANDVVLENITRRILDSFDFNGFDTSNWTQFITHHFTGILLGRRARLLSRPLAFIKNLVGLSTDKRNFLKDDTDEYEKRVSAVVCRLAKLILVKSVESESVSINNILDCCILSDDDVTASSFSELYKTVRSDLKRDKLDFNFSLASNACSNEQLARIKTAARVLNCNVSFHDISDLNVAIDKEEEMVIDPSTSSSDLTESDFGRNFEQQKKRKTPADNGSCSSSGFNYDDGTMDEDGEDSDFAITSKSIKILNKVKSMLAQREINISIIQIINKLEKFLTAHFILNETEYERFGVEKNVIKAGVEAVRRWNEAVKDERQKIIKECNYLDAVGTEYDMNVVTPIDYEKSNSPNCVYAAEAKLCKTNPSLPLFSSFKRDESSSGVNNYTWLNFNDKKEKLSKQDEDIYGGRHMGYALKDCIKTNEGGIAEIRVLAQKFSYNIKDSYWSMVMPPLRNIDEDTTKKKFSKGDQHQNTKIASSLKVNNKIKDVKSMVRCNNLLSLYNAQKTDEDIGVDNFKTTNTFNDVFVVLGGTCDNKNKYKCLFPLWHCNNGISPKNQIELLKKLLFKNTNVLWIKQYDRHINVLNNWGCLNANNVDDLHFSLSHGNVHSEVTDVVPPLSVFHSRYLSENDYEYLLKSVKPITKRDDDDDDSKLLSAVYSREILTSCLDPKGKFCTSCITNSCSVLFTPGTNKRAENFSDPAAYADEDLVGKEEEKQCRSFSSMVLEVTTALGSGVFFQGEKKDKQPGGIRVLRVVNSNERAFEAPAPAVVFEAASNSNVISETNECALLDCQNARCLIMSHRAVLLNNSNPKCYDGEYFHPSSMRYHAGFSKGYLLDDELDLNSMYGKTNLKKKECEIGVFLNCVKHFNTDTSCQRVFITDWTMVKGLMDIGNRNRYDFVNSTLTPFGSNVKINFSKRLKRISHYNRKPIQFDNSQDLFTACFLANPCGPARRLLQRAPNMRLCVTNAGTALLSRIMAQRIRLKNCEEMIMDGSITPFRVTANSSSCISVDGNRYFMIDGNYLLGGRIDNINIVTDMFTRCKLKSEKHVVLNSLFSSKLVSACLATAIEGTTLSQGLGLIEHVSSMKNSEVTDINHKNFWSIQKTAGEGYEKMVVNFEPSLDGKLKPPSIYLNDEDYIFLRMVYEISRAAEYYCQEKGGGDFMTTDKMLNNKKSLNETTTRTALYAIRKCYTACVDQETGMSRMHIVHFFRGLLNFGGLCTAICSGDGEKSHHLIHTLNSVAMNMATKVVVMLVGTSGNNLKTTLIDICKKSWFERFADVSVGVLNSAGETSSSTQTNIDSFAGKKNILIIDEVGYQGFTRQGDNNTEKEEKREIEACRGMAQDTSAVWEQINSAMIKSKLKICFKECNEIMAARSKDVSYPRATSTTQQSDDEDDVRAKGSKEIMTDSQWLIDNRVIRIKSFATSAIWWNCMSGAVSHKFNDSKTTFNMMNRSHYPFSISKYYDSSWLKQTDAIFFGDRGFDKVKEAIDCLLGQNDYDFSMTDFEPLLQQPPPPLLDIDAWKERIKGSNYPNACARAEQIFNDLVMGGEDTLLRWTVTKSVRHDDHRPVISCVSANKTLSFIIKTKMGDDIWRVEASHQRLSDNYDFRKCNASPGGVLYAFHGIHSGHGGNFVTKYEREKKMRKIQSEPDSELGPILERISPQSIDNIRVNSRKLSSIIFGGEMAHEVDEDNYINMERAYDMALFDIIKKPSSASFPQITTDGSLVMKTSTDDCTLILSHIKKNIGKFVHAGSFICMCAENNLLDTIDDEFSHIFGDELALAKYNNNKLNARSQKLMNSLIRYKSDGRTMAASEIACLANDNNDSSNKYMLPGQFNSNTLKKMTSKGSSVYLRSVYSKPEMKSFTITPIMTSNSYLYNFFVDEALSKRMVTFPCETQFAFKSKNEDVRNFVDMVDSGLKCVHVGLLLERLAKWKRAGIEQIPEDVEYIKSVSNKWANIWNASVQRGMKTEEFISDLSLIPALLPARALQLLIKNCVLEHRDASTMPRLEENANTFMHMYTSFTLSSKSQTFAAEEKEEEMVEKASKRKPVFSVNKRSLKPLQMCQINPRSLCTMAMAITRCRQGAWAKINTALNCVIFVDAPFVRTTRLFGEDCNLRMFVPKGVTNPAFNIDWCVGLRIPNPDMGVCGYAKEGAMIGAGAAIMKQVCDAWGSTDIKMIMYSCHHLHMLFELVLQFSHPKCKINGISTIRNNNKAGMDYVAVIFACMIYKEMVSKLKYSVFLDNDTHILSREKNGIPQPLEIPTFACMIINKPLAALRCTTNLSNISKSKTRDHSDMIKYITSQLGQKLNPLYVCPSCKE